MYIGINGLVVRPTTSLEDWYFYTRDKVRSLQDEQCIPCLTFTGSQPFDAEFLNPDRLKGQCIKLPLTLEYYAVNAYLCERHDVDKKVRTLCLAFVEYTSMNKIESALIVDRDGSDYYVSFYTHRDGTKLLNLVFGMIPDVDFTPMPLPKEVTSVVSYLLENAVDDAPVNAIVLTHDDAYNPHVEYETMEVKAIEKLNLNELFNNTPLTGVAPCTNVPNRVVLP